MQLIIMNNDFFNRLFHNFRRQLRKWDHDFIVVQYVKTGLWFNHDPVD